MNSEYQNRLVNLLMDNYINHREMITEEQIDDFFYKEWSKVIDYLYEKAQELYQAEWESTTELNQISQKTGIWETIKYIYEDLIEIVNGFNLPITTDLVCLLVSYITKSHEPSDCKNLTTGDRFRLKFEYYLARQIIEQKRKSYTELEDERNDRLAIRRLVTNKKKKYKRENLLAISNENEKGIESHVSPKWKNDVLYIYKKSTRCHLHKHKLVSATAILVGRNNCSIHLNVEYCAECNKFLMSYGVYEIYREKFGILLGRLQMESNSMGETGDIFLSEYSPLKLCGYSVNQRDGYSSQEREFIISKIIELGVLTKQDIIRYLEYFININGKKNGNEIAVTKWKYDLDFTLNYKLSEQKTQAVQKIQRY